MASEDRVVAKEMGDRSESELEALLNGKREELHKVGFKHAIGQLQQTHLLKSLKRDIARIETVLGQKRSNAGAQS